MRDNSEFIEIWNLRSVKDVLRPGIKIILGKQICDKSESAQFALI